MFGMIQFVVYMLAIVAFLLVAVVRAMKMSLVVPDAMGNRRLTWGDRIWLIVAEVGIIGIIVYMEGFVDTVAKR